MTAKNNGTGGARGSKMNAVREILRAAPHAKASEISKRAEAEYGVTISPKVASTYRYHILGRQRREQRKAVRAAAGPQGMPGRTDGLDHLLRAAEKLGWRRVKEIVDGVLNAPA